MNPVSTPRFSDGRSATVHAVHVDPGPHALRVAAATGAPLAAWPYDGLYLAEEVYRNQPVRLMHRDAGAACLTLPDAAALRALEERSPGLRRALGRARRRTPWRIAAAAGLLAAVVLAAGWGLPRLSAVLVPLVPESWERALGDRFVASVEREYPACTGARDAEGRRALERLVARLRRAAADGAEPPPFAVIVLDSPVPNALAAPGARILVFRGILGLTRTPQELAGVLAHEAGHALARHPERGMLRALGWKWLLGAWFGSGSWGAEGLQTLLVLAYTREDERTADRTAVALLERAGLRSDGLPAFLERLAADPRLNGRGVPAFLASHPLPKERAAELRALLHPQIAGAPWTAREWRAIQGLCGKR
jgi:Zn-dependent protease with chaperone function